MMESLILSATITVTVGAAGGDATRSAAERSGITLTRHSSMN